jgi:hypothetical protein
VEASDEITLSAGSGRPVSEPTNWLWRIPSDDNKQFHIHSSPYDYPTSNLHTIADAHAGSGSVSSEFPPALSVD